MTKNKLNSVENMITRNISNPIFDMVETEIHDALSEIVSDDDKDNTENIEYVAVKTICEDLITNLTLKLQSNERFVNKI